MTPSTTFARPASTLFDLPGPPPLGPPPIVWPEPRLRWVYLAPRLDAEETDFLLGFLRVLHQRRAQYGVWHVHYDMLTGLWDGIVRIVEARGVPWRASTVVLGPGDHARVLLQLMAFLQEAG